MTRMLRQCRAVNTDSLTLARRSPLANRRLDLAHPSFQRNVVDPQRGAPPLTRGSYTGTTSSRGQLSVQNSTPPSFTRNVSSVWKRTPSW